MEILANPIVGQIISIIVAGACGWLAASFTQLRKKEQALYIGIRVLLRSALADAYETYVTDQQPLSLERRREIDEAWEAYTALDGDGAAATMYAEICERPIIRH